MPNCAVITEQTLKVGYKVSEEWGTFYVFNVYIQLHNLSQNVHETMT